MEGDKPPKFSSNAKITYSGIAIKEKEKNRGLLSKRHRNAKEGKES